MNKAHLIHWFIVGAIFLSGCSRLNLWNPDSPQNTATSPIDTSAESIFGPGTFSFAIPSGWDVFGPEKISPDPNRSYNLFILGENPTGQDGPGISRVIIGDAADWTPEDLALVQCSTCPQNPFESVTIGGKPALRTQVGGGGVPLITWHYVENQGHLIAFALIDPQTLLPLDEVIETIIFE